MRPGKNCDSCLMPLDAEHGQAVREHQNYCKTCASVTVNSATKEIGKVFGKLLMKG